MLELLGAVLLVAGVGLLVIGSLAFIIAAFRESVLWGVAVVVLPVASLVFLILHWRAAKDPFFLQISGFALVLVGGLFADWQPLGLR